MSYAKRRGSKNRYGPPFVRLEKHMIFNSEEWKKLSPRAKLLYLYIKSKYNSLNNGEIRLSYAEVKGVMGISSSATFSKAQSELIEKGWVRVTRHGGLYRYYQLYEITWRYDKLR